MTGVQTCALPICGATTGMIQALKKAGIRYEGRVYNHWDIAIATQMLNHPEVVGSDACSAIENVLPDRIFQENPRMINVGWASPSCTHFSAAAGGVPKSAQLRSQPEYIIPYMRMTRTEKFFIENVKQLLTWGPLLDKDTMYKGKKYKSGQPDPRKKCLFFNDWYRSIRASGYNMEWALLNAADYGAATNRERLIVQCVRKSSGMRITWPEPTHVRVPDFITGTPWRSAAEIIDWSDPGTSIFERKEPLKENTLRRIEAGIRKFWGEWAEPFLIILRGTSDYHVQNSAIPVNVPVPTITAGGVHVGVVQPFLTRYNGGDNRNHGVCDPIPVIDTSNRYGLITPMIIPYKFNNQAVSVSDPLQTVTTVNGFSLVTPMFIPQHGDGTVKPVSNPLSTIATSGAISLVTPLLVEYYGNGRTVPVSEAVPVIPTKDRFGLLQGRIITCGDGTRYKLDIYYRMLKSHELAAASSFPADFRFAGTDTEIKKQIGNAVPPALAEALMMEHLKTA